MLNLNRPKTEYRVRMYYYDCTGVKGNVLQYKENGLPFSCAFDFSQDIVYSGQGQGFKYKSLTIVTTANYDFKTNDKVTYRTNGKEHRFIVKNVSIENNSTSGSDYTNSPSALVKTILLEG